MSIQTPPGANDPELPEPAPDPEPDPEPGGPVPGTGDPPQRAPGQDEPPLRMPRDNPDVETEL